ncbi:hypothetical protein ACSYAD_16330 [Acaryochloris marina NIES-2412]|uniref:hypothetical protein n=1 Tax=Acaryochloris marina TaxID=155978 RepID=UPI00405A4332
MKLYIWLASNIAIVAIGCLATAGLTQAQITADSTTSRNIASFTRFGSTGEASNIMIDTQTVFIQGEELDVNSQGTDKDQLELFARTNCIPGLNCPGDPYYNLVAAHEIIYLAS